MLIEANKTVATFRPPPVEELSAGERRRLRAALAGVVASWGGSSSLGLLVGDPRRQDEVPAHYAGPWFRATGAPVGLGLTPEAAVSLLCANLGAPMPTAPSTHLSELDLALLNTWATQALQELATGLAAGPVGQVLRVPDYPQDLAAGSCSVVVAELTFASDMPAGVIVVDAAIARRREPSDPATIGDEPTVLLDATVTAEAIIRATVRLDELLTLEVGDVLILGDKTTVEAELVAADEVMARARPGARGERRALRVTSGLLSDHVGRRGELSDGI